MADAASTNMIWTGLELSSYVGYCFAIVLSIYFNLSLRLKNNEAFIQKRGSFILYGLNTSLIASIVSMLYLQISLLHLSDIHIQLSLILLVSSIWAMLLFLTTKWWLLYFKDNWTRFTLQLRWQQLLNPKVVQHQQTDNWFIKNHQKYGSMQYIFKLFASFCLFGFILCVIAIIVCFIFEWILFCALTHCMTICPALIFYACIVYKTKRGVHDLLSIHWENRMHCKLFFALVSVYVFLNPLHHKIVYEIMLLDLNDDSLLNRQKNCILKI